MKVKPYQGQKTRLGTSFHQHRNKTVSKNALTEKVEAERNVSCRSGDSKNHGNHYLLWKITGIRFQFRWLEIFLHPENNQSTLHQLHTYLQNQTLKQTPTHPKQSQQTHKNKQDGKSIFYASLTIFKTSSGSFWPSPDNALWPCFSSHTKIKVYFQKSENSQLLAGLQKNKTDPLDPPLSVQRPMNG